MSENDNVTNPQDEDGTPDAQDVNDDSSPQRKESGAHKDVSVTSLDAKENQDGRILSWAKNNRMQAALASVMAASALVLGGFGVYALTSDQPLTDVVPARHGIDGYQDSIPEARIIESAGKGTISMPDNQQGGKIVSAPYVGIDATGPESGATLNPPEDISVWGHYFRSAIPGSNKNDGSSVMTSHVNYNGATGIGSLAISLKKGDPITVETPDGKVSRYVVISDPVDVKKQDPAYVKKTMDTINRDKGRNSLILISCSGEYVGGALGFDSNVVVEARLIE